MELAYWKKQKAGSSLFSDIEWNKPERRDQAGKLGIIGGNKLGFLAVAESYQTALETGAGQVRVLLPDVLKKTIPTSITDTLFAPTTPSGSLSRDAAAELAVLETWADGILLVGDAGRNSETAILYEEFISRYSGPLTITRDAIDRRRRYRTCVHVQPNTRTLCKHRGLPPLSDRPGRRLPTR